jgi:hypothetical protein
MKNLNRLLGIIALIAVMGFSLAGCGGFLGNDKTDETTLSFEGTWDNYYKVGNQLVFNEDNFTYKPPSGRTQTKGTFTYTATEITFTCSHKDDNGIWEEYNDGLIGAYWNDVSSYSLFRDGNGDVRLKLGDMNYQGGDFYKKR